MFSRISVFVLVWISGGGVSEREWEQDKLKGNRISLLVNRAKASFFSFLFFPVKSSQEQPGISIFRTNQRRKELDVEKKLATHFLLLKRKVFKFYLLYLFCFV